MSNSKHLPILGVGPLYVIIIMILTASGMIFSEINIIPFIVIPEFQIIMQLLGTVCIALGIGMWLRAVIVDRLVSYIRKNQLITSGIYAYVRNPLYSAFLFACTGALFIYGNLTLLVLPVLYWIFMTILMKCTEEKWLYHLYGAEYTEYCRKVNRCIPWKSR